MTDANTGTYGTLRLETTVSSSAPGIYSDVSWAFYLIEKSGSPNLSYDLSGVSGSVSVVSVGTVWSGTFTFDWRPGGLQTALIASGTTRVYHNADGTPPASFSLTGNMGATGTSGAGGPSSVGHGVSLPTLKVVPGTPTAVAAVRVSDTADTVSWSQSSATNGQPTSNTIRQKVNGGAWTDVVTISPATSAGLTCAANQKLVYGVKATNTAGDSAWSADSSPLYTTPAAPTSVVATKVGSDIQVDWVSNVAFTEHSHVLEHGVDVAGTITWDGSPLATLSAGTSTYTHVAPSGASVHVYRVKAKNTDVAALASATVQSNTVQLLAAPNAPTVAVIPAFVNKAASLLVPWTHNPVDTTAQTAYEFGYSTNGGGSWSSTGKVTSATSSKTIAASTYAADVVLTMRVRTWGSATTGGSEGTGASAWSALSSVTFKTKPVATIVSPANASTYTLAALTVELGFSQAEAATFVNATIGLYSGATLLEEIVSTTLSATLFVTRLADGSSYSVKATVTDSNGVVSSQVTSAFSVDYTEPVPAGAIITYLPDSGIGQIELTIPSAGGGYVAAISVSIDRAIGGVSENVVTDYPTSPTLTILDTTPTLVGDNVYTITTLSADGASSVLEVTLTTAEQEWAFMCNGPGYSQIIRFGGELRPVATPTVDATLLKASGRSRPIALYATTADLVVTGVGDLAPGYGSTPEEIEAFLLTAGRGCYRDPSGRRIFGLISGSISREAYDVAQFTYSITETD